ncbi:hypothetical protein [Variovorax sp. E3]|uniref:hypothetical protein n=1 Tax=Variovorax sp. E3 TaxID=1914993 RepID=UPI0018DE2597|nr:hypothetical protein [Variovorax sp. E3]
MTIKKLVLTAVSAAACMSAHAGTVSPPEVRSITYRGELRGPPLDAAGNPVFDATQTLLAGPGPWPTQETFWMEAVVLREAKEICRKQGRSMKLVSSDPSETVVGPVTFELRYQCL